MSQEVSSLYDLVPGRTIGERYTVVGPSRQGGLSAAFEVRDEVSDETCELQFFPSGLFENEDQAREFAASCTKWKRVHSEAVVGVREIVLVRQTTLLLVTELPIGHSLRVELKERGRFEREEVVALGKQLLRGLVEIHGHGLVHGDIKPHTIHVEGEPSDLRAMLVDGGVTPGLWAAKHLGDQTALIGTPFYAPVEQFGGDSPDVLSDVYNVATVLYEVAAGVLPWGARSFLEVFQAKLEKAPPRIRDRAPDVDVGDDLDRVIAAGLMADRNERHATAQKFLDALNGVE